MPPLNTIQCEYSLLREFAAEDAASFNAALDLTTAGDYASKTGTFTLPSPYGDEASPVNGVEIIFAGTAAADKTFSFALVGYAAENGPAETICTGTGTLGTQAVVKYPHNSAAAANTYYADTISVTSYHVTTIAVADSGNNRIAKVWLDALGYKYLRCIVYDADGSGAEAATVGAYIRWA